MNDVKKRLADLFSPSLLNARIREVETTGVRTDEASQRVRELECAYVVMLRAYKKTLIEESEEVQTLILVELHDLRDALRRARGKLEKLQEERDQAVGRMTRAQSIRSWLQ